MRQYLQAQKFQCLAVLLKDYSLFIQDYNTRFHEIEYQFVIFLPLYGFALNGLQHAGNAVQHHVHLRGILVHHVFVEMYGRVVVLYGIEEESHLAGVVGIESIETSYAPSESGDGDAEP